MPRIDRELQDRLISAKGNPPSLINPCPARDLLGVYCLGHDFEQSACGRWC
jgi:hypothetical protein